MKKRSSIARPVVYALAIGVLFASTLGTPKALPVAGTSCRLTGGPSSGFRFSPTHAFPTTINATGNCFDGLKKIIVQLTGTERPLPEGSNLYSYGSCAQGDLASGLLVLIDATLTVNTGGQVRSTNYVLRWPYSGLDLNTPWPGPVASVGAAFDPVKETLKGRITMSTRIAGMCPPAGTYAATYYLRLDPLLGIV